MYCTYLTIYKGNKLPMFYVGSTSISKINSGYRGSVSSREYKKIWKSEIINNKHLFDTKIISIHATRKEAMEKEYFFHKKLNVVTNNLYANKANAIPDGQFGIDVTGKNNPMYGKKRPDSKNRMKTNNPMSDPTISKKVTEAKKLLRKNGQHKTTRNSQVSLDRAKLRMSIDNPSNMRCCCIVCNKETIISAIIRFHKTCKIETFNKGNT